MTPEFARPERVDTIGERERTVSVAADPAERAAIAGRFGLVAVHRLEASFTVKRDGAGIRAAGATRACVLRRRLHP